MNALIGSAEQAPGVSEFNDIKNDAIKRVGFSIINIDRERYRMAELHLASAIESLQKLQRMEEWNGQDS
jgi:hypothetical protein